MNQDAAGPVGARMARACDGCLLKRARWYCATDDVFLCQACDKSSHSSTKQRSHHHERVRLKSSTSLSNLKPPTRDHDGTTGPAWQRAITRKARTPRMYNKHGSTSSNNKGGGEVQERMSPVVPDLDVNEEAEDLIFSVPIFNPVLSDQLFSPSHQEQDNIGGVFDVKPPPAAATITECLASDLDIADFDMDMDSLFGNESQSMYYHMGDWESGGGSDTGGAIASISAFMESSGSVKEEVTCDEINHGLAIVSEKRKDMMLKLDFDAVIHGWCSTQGSSSPWTDGKRPSLSNHENMELTACIERGGGKKIAGEEQQQALAVPKYTDLRREAMVSRYREKRRTRLFAKKIRYEVRKLNAEKRPRIKGRFVKRKE